jgi:hypothetical protein
VLYTSTSTSVRQPWTFGSLQRSVFLPEISPRFRTLLNHKRGPRDSHSYVRLLQSAPFKVISASFPSFALLPSFGLPPKQGNAKHKPICHQPVVISLLSAAHRQRPIAVISPWQNYHLPSAAALRARLPLSHDSLGPGAPGLTNRRTARGQRRLTAPHRGAAPRSSAPPATALPAAR